MLRPEPAGIERIFSIRRQAWRVVVWSRSPNFLPMRTSDCDVSFLQRCMATWRAATICRSRRDDSISGSSSLKLLQTWRWMVAMRPWIEMATVGAAGGSGSGAWGTVGGSGDARSAAFSAIPRTKSACRLIAFACVGVSIRPRIESASTTLFIPLPLSARNGDAGGLPQSLHFTLPLAPALSKAPKMRARRSRRSISSRLKSSF